MEINLDKISWRHKGENLELGRTNHEDRLEENNLEVQWRYKSLLEEIS
jgi:hypothetical protein